MRLIFCLLLQAICSIAFHDSQSRFDLNTHSNGCSSRYVSSQSRRYVSETTSFEKTDSDIVMKEVETILLPKLFGHPQFRPGQREVISKLLAGESCLAILPTGAGKSLLYMLPSQLLDGITLVVSPLLALMRDQVEALRKEGISAVRLDSSMSPEEIKLATSEMVSGRVKVLYVTPERFNNEKFRRLLESLKVAMFVVDEAHCISEWGHAFRPDYLRLSDFATASNAQVRLALTATATKRVAQDILERLDIKPQNTIQLPSSRKNLKLSVSTFSYPYDGYEEKLCVLLEALPGLAKGDSAIIYVNKVHLAEKLATDLKKRGYNTRAYSSVIPDREGVEQWFLQKSNDVNRKAPIVVGTTAFGMGIDKSDVRSVVHFDLSRSVEDYVQGIGRAGRDGKDAFCSAFLADTDIPELRSQCKGITPTYKSCVDLVKIIFGAGAFPAKYDSAMFISTTDIAWEIDVNSVQIVMSLSYLVQQGVLSFLTPQYSIFKVGRVDEGAYTVLVKKLKAEINSENENDSDDEIHTLEEIVRMNEKTLDVTMKLCEHVRVKAKRKWCTVDVIELANQWACTPAEVASCVASLVSNNVCENGGASSIFSRFRVLKSNLMIDELEQIAIAGVLYEHAVEIQRRGIVRVNELVGLLRGGSDGNIDMWNNISKYFKENEDDVIAENPISIPNYEKNEIHNRILDFDEIAWKKIVALVESGFLPNDDVNLIVRFATGVNSPRLIKFKHSKNILFGVMKHCEWDDVYNKTVELLS